MDVFMRWLNRMHAEGYFDPESFTQTMDEWAAKIASGRVLSVAFMQYFYSQARLSLIAEGQADRTYAFLPIMAGPQYRSVALKDPGFGGGYGISITSTCKDPERAFEFLDWMCSEEAQILVNWGIEGVNYDVVNGKRILRQADRDRMASDPDYVKTSGVGRWAYPFPMKGQGWVDAQGNYMTPADPESIKASYIPVERETLAAYGAEMWTDLFPQPETLGISPYGEAWLITLTPELNRKYTEAHDRTETAIGTLIAAKPADFNTLWAKYQQDLKDIGMVEAGVEMTQLIQNKVKMWND
jgi:putative aldouronate transport system substrate-binding protein